MRPQSSLHATAARADLCGPVMEKQNDTALDGAHGLMH
jgi:hypothetical protein